MERRGFRNEHTETTTVVTAHVSLLKSIAAKTEAFCHHWHISTLESVS